MCYSIDMVKKMAFEKEIDHITHAAWFHNEGAYQIVLEYLQERIKEIELSYKDPYAA